CGENWNHWVAFGAISLPPLNQPIPYSFRWVDLTSAYGWCLTHKCHSISDRPPSENANALVKHEERTQENQTPSAIVFVIECRGGAPNPDFASSRKIGRSPLGHRRTTRRNQLSVEQSLDFIA